jgi:hypothetical protein
MYAWEHAITTPSLTIYRLHIMYRELADASVGVWSSVHCCPMGLFQWMVVGCVLEILYLLFIIICTKTILEIHITSFVVIQGIKCHPPTLSQVAK